MGADLFGILCKGPKYLNESLRDTAVLIAEDRIGRIKDFIERWEDESLADELVGGPTPADLPSEDEVEEMCQLVDCQEIEDFVHGQFDDLNPEQVVREFFMAWIGNYSDVTWREDPDNHDEKILFAGEMSWGGEPEGDGYKALRLAERFGLFDLFGIR